MTDDANIQDHIERLVAREHKLLETHGADGLTDEEHAELERVRIQLDRYWDLLRQRRAREEFGMNPNEASLRDEGTVEGYWQ